MKPSTVQVVPSFNLNKQAMHKFQHDVFDVIVRHLLGKGNN